MSETLSIAIAFPAGAYPDDLSRKEIRELAEEARDEALERRGWVATSELTCDAILLPTDAEPFCRAMHSCTAEPKPQ